MSFRRRAIHIDRHSVQAISIWLQRNVESSFWGRWIVGIHEGDDNVATRLLRRRKVGQDNLGGEEAHLGKFGDLHVLVAILCNFEEHESSVISEACGQDFCTGNRGSPKRFDGVNK